MCKIQAFEKLFRNFSAMLTEGDRQRIKLEESYCRDFRSELDTGTPINHKRIPAFLNSAFGLWVLSTAVISGGGAMITRYYEGIPQKKHAAETVRLEDTRRTELIDRLDYEISYRLSQVLQRLYNLTDKAAPLKLATNYSASDVAEALSLLSATRTGKFPPLYSEFSQLGLPELMAEIRRNAPDPERKRIDASITKLTLTP